jgi:hypothetical protein
VVKDIPKQTDPKTMQLQSKGMAEHDKRINAGL